MGQKLLSIGEVAEVAGIRPSALRYYEEVGLLHPAARVGGRRRYEPSVLRRIGVVALLREAGFSIKEVRALLQAGAKPRSWRPFAERKARELQAQLAETQKTLRLLERALTCDCERLEGCAAVQERLGSHSRPRSRRTRG